MAPTTIGPVTRAWYRWKALRLPWRRQFLVGLDLQGNTYWEFRLAGTTGSERWRRIVKYPRSTHYSEVRITPQWHQWLRYARQEPPSLAEQRTDVARQDRIRSLAAQADARWEAKPRLAGHDEASRSHQQAVLGGATTTTAEATTAAEPATATAAATATTPQAAPKATTTAAPTTTTASNTAPPEPPATRKPPKTKPKKTQPDPWAKAKASGPSETWQPQAWTPKPRTK